MHAHLVLPRPLDVPHVMLLLEFALHVILLMAILPSQPTRPVTLAPLDVPHVALMENAALVLLAMFSMVLHAKLAVQTVKHVALMESVPHVTLVMLSTVTLAQLVVLAVTPVLLLMERLSPVPNVTTTMLSSLLIALAKLAILANMWLRARTQFAQPAMLENSTKLAAIAVSPAQIPSVRLALAKRVVNAQLVMMASMLSLEPVELDISPALPELHHLLEVLDTT